MEREPNDSGHVSLNSSASSEHRQYVQFIVTTCLLHLTTPAQRQRRIWLIDRHATTIGFEMRSDLGNWIRRRLKKGIAEQGDEAQSIIHNCGFEVSELWKQWSDQCSTQLSIQARESSHHTAEVHV